MTSLLLLTNVRQQPFFKAREQTTQNPEKKGGTQAIIRSFEKCLGISSNRFGFMQLTFPRSRSNCGALAQKDRIVHGVVSCCHWSRPMTGDLPAASPKKNRAEGILRVKNYMLGYRLDKQHFIVSLYIEYCGWSALALFHAFPVG